MFVELIEHLRCPRGHEPSLLVGVATRSEHRHIIDGVLGCPACGAEFEVRGGVARFGPSPRPAPEPPAMETAIRVAALLELNDARGFVILAGRWGAHAGMVAQMAETPLVFVNPPAGADLTVAAAVIETDAALPVVEGAARAAAIDPLALDPLSCVNAVRPGGRVLGPASLPLPDGLREIARDEREWVAERVSQTAPRLVELRRAR